MIVTVSGLEKAFNGVPVLRDVELTLAPDRPMAVTGPSGSGKTTLLRILLGRETADAGTVTFDPAPPRFAVVFQEDRLLERFDAVENLRLSTGLRDAARLEKELLRLLPGEVLHQPVRLLSGGQRRRVCIVRACLAPADVVVMDEPFSGLDAGARAAAGAYIREHAAGRPLLLALHEADVPAWCDRLTLPLARLPEGDGPSV